MYSTPNAWRRSTMTSEPYRAAAPELARLSAGTNAAQQRAAPDVGDEEKVPERRTGAAGARARDAEYGARSDRGPFPSGHQTVRATGRRSRTPGSQGTGTCAR